MNFLNSLIARIWGPFMLMALVVDRLGRILHPKSTGQNTEGISNI